MEQLETVKAFEALAHETRLAAFRLMIPAGAEGLPAGVIGERLDLAANSLSFHLTRLVNAGLVGGRRQGRHIYYAVDYARLSGLVAFLADDCCAAVPEGCAPDCPGAAPASGRRRKRK